MQYVACMVKKLYTYLTNDHYITVVALCVLCNSLTKWIILFPTFKINAHNCKTQNTDIVEPSLSSLALQD